MLLNFLQYLCSSSHHVLLCSAVFSMLIFLGAHSSYLVSLVCQYFCGMDQLFGLDNKLFPKLTISRKAKDTFLYT